MTALDRSFGAAMTSANVAIHDGDVDVVTGSHGNAPVTVFHKESGGNWDESGIEKDCEDCDSQDAWSIDVGDYNADGLLDVLVGGFWDMDLTPFANSVVLSSFDSRASYNASNSIEKPGDTKAL